MLSDFFGHFVVSFETSSDKQVTLRLYIAPHIERVRCFGVVVLNVVLGRATAEILFVISLVAFSDQTEIRHVPYVVKLADN